jgi:hypothetical protein
LKNSITLAASFSENRFLKISYTSNSKEDMQLYFFQI